MPVSGLVLTCEEAGISRLLEDVGTLEGFQPGDPQGCRLPVVVDSPDRIIDRQRYSWLEAHPSVISVDIAFIHFEEGDAPQHSDPEDSHAT